MSHVVPKWEAEWEGVRSGGIHGFHKERLYSRVNTRYEVGKRDRKSNIPSSTIQDSIQSFTEIS